MEGVEVTFTVRRPEHEICACARRLPRQLPFIVRVHRSCWCHAQLMLLERIEVQSFNFPDAPVPMYLHRIASIISNSSSGRVQVKSQRYCTTSRQFANVDIHVFFLNSQVTCRLINSRISCLLPYLPSVLYLIIGYEIFLVDTAS